VEAVDQDLFGGTGRRKRAIARVRMTLGQGVMTINNKSVEDYFGRESLVQIARQALEVTQTGTRFDVNVKAIGGGMAGQAGAVRHGVARALLDMDEALRETLRKNGLLTRDPREKESKKYGRKRARKRFQFSKR
jgi:small subunit ribosomal protein S9